MASLDDQPLTSTFPETAYKEELDNGFSGRELGSFEQYLMDTREGCGCVALAHVSAANVEIAAPNSSVEMALKEALAATTCLHPLLRACIRGKGEFFEPIPMLRIGEDSDPPHWCPVEKSPMEIADMVLEEKVMEGDKEMDFYWKEVFQEQLDNAYFEEDGPLWRVIWLHTADDYKPSWLIFAFNHAISDQTSANMLLDQVLAHMDGKQISPSKPYSYKVPPSIEETVGARGMTVATAKYAIEQMVNGGKSPVLLPETLSQNLPVNLAELPKEHAMHPSNRRTFCEFRTLPANEFKVFAKKCKAEGVTVTAGLSAIQMIVSAAAALEAYVDGEGLLTDDKTRTYKFLVAVDLRPFDENQPGEDWTGGTVASSGGAIDFTTNLKDSFVKDVVSSDFLGNADQATTFWDLARECREQTLRFIATDKVRETAIMFNWGMTYVDIREVMKMEAKSPKTLGRLFSSGLSNMGIYKHETEHNNLKLKTIHYATSQTITGCLHQLSCGTVKGELCCTYQFTEPISSRQEGEWFATKSVDIMRALILSEVESAQQLSTISI